MYAGAPDERWPPTIAWSRERGWLNVQDPYSGMWVSIPARDAPQGWVRLANAARKTFPVSRYRLGNGKRSDVLVPAARNIDLPHWSASRFMVFDQCPAEFKARYVDGVRIEETEALCFGKAVHLGLEEHYHGGDGWQAFRVAWKRYTDELEGRVGRGLTAVGLELIEQTVALGLSGAPEYPFSIETEELGAPIVGAMDLWCSATNTIYDFKTTRGKWSDARAQDEVWQPTIYSWAAWLETERLPAFEYIVLNRISGTLERFRRQWTDEEQVDATLIAWKRMQEIADLVDAGDMACHGRHGNCLECGEKWTHDHACDETKHRRRARL
jgi:hypothetical protein